MGRGTRDTSVDGVLNIASRTDEFTKTMVISTYFASRGGHHSIITTETRESKSKDENSYRNVQNVVIHCSPGGQTQTNRSQSGIASALVQEKRVYHGLRTTEVVVPLTGCTITAACEVDPRTSTRPTTGATGSFTNALRRRRRVARPKPSAPKQVSANVPGSGSVGPLNEVARPRQTHAQGKKTQ